MSAPMGAILYKPAGHTLFLSGVNVGFATSVGYNRVRVEEPHRPACAAHRTTKDCM